MAEFWYVASPYSLYIYGKEAAAREVGMAALELTKRGFTVFSPIAHSHAMCLTAPKLKDDGFFWEIQDRPFLEAAMGLIVVKMRGWSESIGVDHEIKRSREMKKPIMYLEWDDESREDSDAGTFPDRGDEERSAWREEGKLSHDSGTVVPIVGDQGDATTSSTLYGPA
tara:strand:- start:405 stop:908 length:504 start_codon:yes stop_codon:yes gene_type:complete